jgi:hypothetical protein
MPSLGERFEEIKQREREELGAALRRARENMAKGRELLERIKQRRSRETGAGKCRYGGNSPFLLLTLYGTA